NWAVSSAPVVDGNGNVMATDTLPYLRFNYGQRRHLNGVTHVFARGTSAGSAAWFPIDHVVSEKVLSERLGDVKAHDTGEERMGCYAIRDWHDPALEMKKVVYDATGSHERAGDYLPLPRANGARYANLAFNVPGFALGGPSIDIYPAGTKFR